MRSRQNIVGVHKNMQRLASLAQRMYRYNINVNGLMHSLLVSGS